MRRALPIVALLLTSCSAIGRAIELPERQETSCVDSGEQSDRISWTTHARARGDIELFSELVPPSELSRQLCMKLVVADLATGESAPTSSTFLITRRRDGSLELLQTSAPGRGSRELPSISLAGTCVAERCVMLAQLRGTAGPALRVSVNGLLERDLR